VSGNYELTDYLEATRAHLDVIRHTNPSNEYAIEQLYLATRALFNAVEMMNGSGDG
jgi:hypothetical protein